MRATRLVLAALLVAAPVAGPIAAEEADGASGDDPRFPTEAVIVGTQQAGTFGDSPEEAELGTELGADLREARISMTDAGTVRFVIDLEKLPPIGGTPEVIRYTWDMTVDGVVAQLDGKFTNYSRGVCDPTSGQCDPGAGNMPRDPGMAPFLFRGNLSVLETPALTFNAMEELALIEAEFHVEEATITVDVPVETIDLLDGVEFGDCSTIGPGAGLRNGTVETSLAAFLTSAAFPADVLFGTAGFVAPHAIDAEVDCFGEEIGGDEEPGEE